MHRESDLIIFQKDATVFSALYFCWRLYMFRVLTPETCRAAYRNTTLFEMIVGVLTACHTQYT